MSEGSWLVGREAIEYTRREANPAFPDFRLDLNHNRGWAEFRTIEVKDMGDPPDIAIGRAGPDGADWNATPTPTESGANVGSIYWRVWGTNNDWAGDVGGGSGRIAQITARLEGIPTGTSRPGSLRFWTTPPGSVSPVERLTIDEIGRFWMFDYVTGQTRQIKIAPVDGNGRRVLYVE